MSMTHTVLQLLIGWFNDWYFVRLFPLKNNIAGVPSNIFREISILLRKSSLLALSQNITNKNVSYCFISGNKVHIMKIHNENKLCFPHLRFKTQEYTNCCELSKRHYILQNIYSYWLCFAGNDFWLYLSDKHRIYVYLKISYCIALNLLRICFAPK